MGFVPEIKDGSINTKKSTDLIYSNTRYLLKRNIIWSSPLVLKRHSIIFNIFSGLKNKIKNKKVMNWKILNMVKYIHNSPPNPVFYLKKKSLENSL